MQQPYYNRRDFLNYRDILEPRTGGEQMLSYIGGVFLLNFAVDILLLLAASRLCGYPVKLGRICLGGLLGGVYGAVCLLPGFSFLGNFFWRGVSFCLIAATGYGLFVSSIRQGILFGLLALALGGAITGLNTGGVAGTLSVAGIIAGLCFFGFRGHTGGQNYLPVELTYGTAQVHITALRDTGNTLRDPITGHRVLVVSADVAEKLTGLTRQQLRTPLESLPLLPGLRLIPYRSVGSNGFLLAIRVPKARIGCRQESTLVAFAPDFLSPDGTYQALTGGEV